MGNKTILVTGSTGFVGAQLVQRLSQDLNNKIICIERDGANLPKVVSGFFTTLPRTKTLHGDITDFDFMRRVIADEEINEVFHFAANSIVRSCANDPLTAYRINVIGTLNLLEAIRVAGMNHIKSICISTSDKAMGHSLQPYNETSFLKPKYTYEATKACQDIVSQNYFHNYGLPVKILRCSNIYGPGDPNHSRIIPNTILKLNKNERPILFSGVANYIREFVFIDDVLDAFQLVNDKADPGEIFCVGGTESIKVIDLVKKITALHGSTLEPEIRDRAENFREIENQWIDAAKLKGMGWKPKWSLEKGLQETIEYYRGI